MVVKETEMIKQHASNNITLIYANATAQATRIRAQADAQAFKTEYEGYASAFKNLDNNVQIKDDNALISMMYAEMLSKLTNHTNFNLGFSQAGITITDVK